MSSTSVIQPKFPIGSYVDVPRLDSTGLVMLWKRWPKSLYFVDLFPGAASDYEYLWLFHPVEHVEYCCPGNWLPEADLKKLRKGR